MTNADLGRTGSLQAPIARRREREGTTFNTRPRLGTSNYEKLEKKGRRWTVWWISDEFEPLGGIDYNEFPECLGEFED